MRTVPPRLPIFCIPGRANGPRHDSLVRRPPEGEVLGMILAVQWARQPPSTLQRSSEIINGLSTTSEFSRGGVLRRGALFLEQR